LNTGLWPNWRATRAHDDAARRQRTVRHAMRSWSTASMVRATPRVGVTFGAGAPTDDQQDEDARRAPASAHDNAGRLPHSERAPTAGDPLVRTKLYPPALPSDVMPRARLARQLEEGFGSRLTLVSAPAGYGKTTLISAWTAASGLPVAWLSLDDGDNDPARFWSYVIAALVRLRAARGAPPAIAGLEDLPPAPTEPAITAIINTFAGAPQPVALVLDDYHVIHNEAIHRTVLFLIEHLPAHLRLVIASRSDPPLALARLRARGQLRELRAADLRFTAEEADAFLSAATGLQLRPSDVAGLEARTEGWIAGLRLAAHALLRHADVTGFIADFGGSHRSVVDFLVDEVLTREPPEIQAFLLQTSILERLSAPLCDAVTGRVDSQQALDRLERSNLFVVSLDEERRWSRYHHLFAEVLRERLRQARQHDERLLHARAAAWFHAQGDVPAALSHALAAHDIDRAVFLLTRAASPFLMRGEFATLLGWLDTLPGPRVRCSSRLCRVKAWALVYSGQFEELESWLRYAELGCWIETPDEVRGEIATIRAAAARARGDGQAALRLYQEGLALLSGANHTLQGVTLANLAACYGLHNDLASFERALDAADQHARSADDPCLWLVLAARRAYVQTHRGQLGDAQRVYEAALRLAVADGRAPFPATSFAYLGLGEIACERNALDEATRRLTDSITLGEGGRFNLAIDSWLCLARVKQAQGDEAGADEAITQAQALADACGVEHIVAASVCRRVQLWLAQGRLALAEQWAASLPNEIAVSTAFRDDAQDITVARVWLAAGKHRQASNLLAQLQDVTEATGRVWRAIEALALRAVAEAALNNEQAALALLERALTLAEPGGYVRTFVEAGAGLTPLLEQLLERRQRQHDAAGPSITYLRGVLAAFEQPSAAPGCSKRAVQGSERQAQAPLLSARELEVLRCMVSGASNQQIAAELFITVGTIKRHLHNIYSKLDVNNRTRALARARELGLLDD
jgi:LuxR family maltose regulon positive regulatory protein